MVRWPLRIHGIWARSSTPARRTRRPCGTCDRRPTDVTPSAATWSRTKRSGWAVTLRPSSSSSMLTRFCGDQSGRKASGPSCSSRARRGWSRPSPAGGPGVDPGGRPPGRPRAGVEQRHLRDQLLAAHAEGVEGAEAREVLGDLAADARARHEVRQRRVRPRRAGGRRAGGPPARPAGLPAAATAGDVAARRRGGRGRAGGGEGGSWTHRRSRPGGTERSALRRPPPAPQRPAHPRVLRRSRAAPPRSSP